MGIAVPNRTSPPYLVRAGRVLKAWLRRPGQVATVCPSSSYLTEAIVDRDCVREAGVVVELGPGAGGTTASLLQQMRPDSRLLAIEINGDLARAAAEIPDPRLIVEQADAGDLPKVIDDHDIRQADVIVSGIPFSSIPEMSAKSVMLSIHQTLRVGGTFIAYQLREDVCDYARPLFGPPSVISVPLNLPPLQVYWWQKVAAESPEVLAGSSSFNGKP